MKINHFYIKLLSVFLFIGISSNSQAQFQERAFDMDVDHINANASLIAGGCAIFDANNDGWLDFYVVGGTNNDGFYINQQVDFQKKIAYLGVEDIDYYDIQTTGVAAGDINNDGWEDLIVTTMKREPIILMLNNMNNTFDVIPPEVSGITDSSWSSSASFGDYNKDGWLDIAVACYVDTPKIELDPITGETVFKHIGFKNKLYFNNGDGTFEDVGELYGMNKKGTSLAITFTDYDNDNDVDLYMVNDFGEYVEPNEMFQNQYPVENFENVSVSSGTDIGLYGMGVAIGDYDNDLDLDYYVTNLGKNELLQNNGDGTFTISTDFAGVQDSSNLDGMAVGWGTGFIDYDNDGWLDLYISNGFIPAAGHIENSIDNPNAFYENNKDGTFTNTTREMGVIENAKGRGSAYGDLNNDGLLDFIIVPVEKPGLEDPNARSEVAMFYNITSNTNNWVQFKLVGVKSNKNGFGSHVYLYDSEGNVQMREVDGGSSHGSSNSSIVHFGIGNATSVDSIKIIWTNGIEQTVEDITINQLNVIEENEEVDVVNNVIDLSQLQWSVYPNPAKREINIVVNSNFSQVSTLKFKIVAVNGQLMLEEKLSVENSKIDISNWHAGNYLIHIFSDNEKLATKEFIKQ